MTEYIITGEQLERLGVPDMFTEQEIVRCRDCTGLVETWDGWECEQFSGEYHRAEPDGFCAWGERLGK